jgi:hypothetical protein
MEMSANGAEAITFILISIAIPIIIFGLVPVLIIRSVIKSVKSKLPAGTNLSQLRQLVKQFPKGANWQKITKEWDFKMDPTTKRITLKRKPGATPVQGSSMPNEIQIDSLSQLPAVMKQLDSGQAPIGTPQSGKIESNEPTSPPPVSVSSKISGAPQTRGPSPIKSPRSYEIIQTIKRVAIILVLIGLFYGIKSFFA